MTLYYSKKKRKQLWKAVIYAILRVLAFLNNTALYGSNDRKKTRRDKGYAPRRS